MSQQEWIILAFKVTCVTGFMSLAAWVIQYTRYTHGAAWRDPLGRTLVMFACCIAGLLAIFALSLFFHLNRLTSYAAGWLDVALIGAVTPVICWRMLEWRRAHKEDSPGKLR